MPATKIQTFKRLLDASDATLWVIDARGRLVYLSAAMESWLGIDPISLLGRMSLAGTPISSDPLDQLAASLSPPPGLQERGTASLSLQPILPVSGQARTPKVLPREARFVCVGRPPDHFVIAIAGDFNDRTKDVDLNDTVALRQLLTQQRHKSRSAFSAITAGSSPLARRLRHRLNVASNARYNVLLVGEKGFRGEIIGMGLHQSSAAGESIVSIDGGLMDVELLEASLSPATMRLVESKTATATAMIKSLDRMPIEAQDRLAIVHLQFEGRLRLIATCRRIKETPASESSQEEPEVADLVSTDFLAAEKSSLATSIVDLFCAHLLRVPPIMHRVEDIPLMATALVDHCHAHGETSAQRINRAALDALVIYPWPQDYREFEATLRSAGRMTSGSVIGKDQLPLSVRSYRPGDPAAEANVANVPLDDVIKRFETQLIQAAVKSANGNRAEAARRLGISRTRLLRKLDEIKKTDHDT